MEVFLHIEGYVDRCDGKKESCLILLHYLHQRAISLHKSQDQLKREYSTSSKICLRILALKSQSHPLFARSLGWLLKVLLVQGIDKVPSLLVFKQDVGLYLKGVEALQFSLVQRVIFTQEVFSTLLAMGMCVRLTWQKVSFGLHIIICILTKTQTVMKIWYDNQNLTRQVGYIIFLTVHIQIAVLLAKSLKKTQQQNYRVDFNVFLLKYYAIVHFYFCLHKILRFYMLDKADTNNQFPAQFKVLINKSSPGQALFRAWEFQHSRFSIVFDNLSSSQMGKIFIYLVDYKKSNPKVNGVVLNRCMVEIHKKYQNSLQKAQVEVNEAHKTSVGKQRVKLSPEQLKVQTNTKILINEKEEKSEQKQEQLDKTQIESLLTGQQEELRERLL